MALTGGNKLVAKQLGMISDAMSSRLRSLLRIILNSFASKPRGWLVFGCAILFCALLGALYLIPRLQVSYYQSSAGSKMTLLEAADLENKFRTTLASIVGGLAVLIGLWFTFQQVRYLGVNARISEENVRLTAKSKNMDRLTKAMEFLSSPMLSRRVAGVTILGSVGMDDIEDTEAALRVLLRYIPEQIPFRDNSVPLPDDIVGAFTQIGRLLGKLDDKQFEEINHAMFGFQHFDLSNAGISYAYIAHSVFREVNLERTNFFLSTFLDVRFSYKANIRGTQFFRCNLTDVKFFGSDPGADSPIFFHCEFLRVNFKGLGRSSFQDSTFKDCDLSYAKFARFISDSRFENCLMVGCNLGKTNIRSAQLSNSVSLYDAILPDNVKNELMEAVPHLFKEPMQIRSSRPGICEFFFYPTSDGVYRPDNRMKMYLSKRYKVDASSVETLYHGLMGRGMLDPDDTIGAAYYSFPVYL